MSRWAEWTVGYSTTYQFTTSMEQQIWLREQCSESSVKGSPISSSINGTSVIIVEQDCICELMFEGRIGNTSVLDGLAQVHA